MLVFLLELYILATRCFLDDLDTATKLKPERAKLDHLIAIYTRKQHPLALATTLVQRTSKYLQEISIL